jgi:hypothetical protein
MTIQEITRAMLGVLGLGCTLLLSSCFETKQEFTLNPDGSGKVRHECSFQNINLGNDSDTSQEALQTAVAKVIKNAKGVEAWSDVTFKRLDDGRMWFQGTAYFKNLAELEIPNQSMLAFAWKNQGGGTAQLDLTLKKSADQPAKPQPANLTPDERAKKIKDDRAKFQQSKPMMSSFLGSLKQSVTFHLPGKIAASSNMEKKPAGTLSLTFTGAKMLEAFEKLVTDDTWLAKQGFDMKEGPALDNSFAALMFGEKAPVQATVSGASTPLFNYAAEVAAAKKQAAKLQKQLGGVSIAPPATGAALKSLKVVGVRLCSEVDKKLDLRPFFDNVGFTLAVLAEFPGSVLDITDKSPITAATASDGSDLLKGDKDWDRRIQNPRLSADKASAIFEVPLKLPPPAATGIKEISGTLQYRVAAGTKTIDLGLKALKVGAQGTELGASIKDIKENVAKDGSQNIELKLRLSPDDLIAAALLVDGTKSELSRYSTSSMNGVTTFTFKAKSVVPEKGSIVVEIHDQIQTFESPFKLENLSLLGAPVASGK